MSDSDTVATLLAGATTRLATALALDKREARIEARVLLAHALKVDHAWLIAHDRDIPAGAQRDAIERLIERRAGGEPIAYIVGEREFFGRTFRVTPDVLIPRPETELLIETALRHLPKERHARILDLGTGSGCIAITLAMERPDSDVWAVEINPKALCIAQQNALQHDIHNFRVVLGNWYDMVDVAEFDLIVSNPPYIGSSDYHLQRGDLRFEPTQALTPGEDGLHAIRCIVAKGGRYLRAGGMLMIEHGWDQGGACRELFHLAGLEAVISLRDLAGLERVTLGIQNA